MWRWVGDRLNRSGRVDVSGLFFLLMGILLVFLLVALQSLSNRNEETRKLAEQEFRTAAAGAAQLLRSELTAGRAEMSIDPDALSGLAARLGMERVMIWHGDGRLLFDSSPAGKPAITLLPPQEQVVLDRDGRFTRRLPTPSGGQIDTFWLPLPRLADPFGMPGVMAAAAPVPAALLLPEGSNLAWSLRLLMGGALLLLAYVAIRALRGNRLRSRSAAGEEGREQEQFVMGTFEGLIHELKEKEQELAKLRSLAETRAEQVESYNESILRSVASGVLTVDRDLRVTSFNEAAERILGLSGVEVVGKQPAQLFGADHPLTGMIRQTLDRREWLSRQELELEGPNGRVWVGLSVSPLHDKQGTPLGATVVFTDLTEIRQLQEQVELRRRLASLGEMSAGIAHEFRNYMGTIMGYARLVAKRLPPDDPTATMADAITEELKSMNRLIDDLLNFGRRTELSLQPTNLAELVRHTVAKVAPRGTDERVAITLDLPRESPPLLSLDSALMRQALLNLFNNAIDAMPEGGTLTVSMKPSGQRHVELAVQDTGVGIAPENMEKIFLPMFTTKQKGTGLGLALAHKIVLSHGGRFTVESREGSGTTFRIVLPVASVPLPAAS